VAGRAYDSAVRREKARQTERRILAAARELLVADGWAGTTMAGVAAAAGVSAQLLYKTYGTKVALAKRLYDVTLAGDDEPVALRDRPEIAAIIAEADPGRKVALYVRLALRINERLGALESRLRGAAAAGEPELAELVAQTDAERLAGNAAFVAHLAAVAALRPGLAVERAVDAVWTLLSPEVLRALTTGRGWSYDEAEPFLTDQLRAALLGK
jgi:AcrR family transcriptional regulator